MAALLARPNCIILLDVFVFLLKVSVHVGDRLLRFSGSKYDALGPVSHRSHDSATASPTRFSLEALKSVGNVITMSKKPAKGEYIETVSLCLPTFSMLPI
jgi:hypothetical protein